MGNFTDALSVGYHNIERLAPLCWNRSAAVLSCHGVPRDLEVLIVSSIVNAVYRHRKMMSGVDSVVEYLGSIEDRLGLTVCEMSP